MWWTGLLVRVWPPWPMDGVIEQSSYWATLAQQLALWWREFMKQLMDPWVIVGFVGQTVFFARFLVQWITSERRGESTIPVAFWYLSIIGSVICLAYGIRIANPVLIGAFSTNSIIYVRNLMLIEKKRRRELQV